MKTRWRFAAPLPSRRGPPSRSPRRLTANFSLSVSTTATAASMTRLETVPRYRAAPDYCPAGRPLGPGPPLLDRDWDVKGPLELDLYGGYKGEIQKDLGYDVGLLQYAYPATSWPDVGRRRRVFNANTTEIYGALTYGSDQQALARASTNLFGNSATSPPTNERLVPRPVGSFDLGRASPWCRTWLPEGRQDRQRLLHRLLADALEGPRLRLLGQRRDRRHRCRQSCFYASPVNGKFLGKTSGFVSVKYVF